MGPHAACAPDRTPDRRRGKGDRLRHRLQRSQPHQSGSRSADGQGDEGQRAGHPRDGRSANRARCEERQTSHRPVPRQRRWHRFRRGPARPRFGHSPTQHGGRSFGRSQFGLGDRGICRGQGHAARGPSARQTLDELLRAAPLPPGGELLRSPGSIGSEGRILSRQSRLAIGWSGCRPGKSGR